MDDNTTPSVTAAFGTVFADQMAMARYDNGQWHPSYLSPTAAIPMHPAAHVLHYASSCFEGMKAFRWPDGSIRIFRMDQHIQRMVKSSKLLYLPVPDTEMLEQMLREVTDAARDVVPGAPGALYLRPSLIGTMENIGAAGSPSESALLFILASPVGDYFGNDDHATRILLTDNLQRSTHEFGMAKAGANYAQALGTTMQARKEYQADTVLFAPGGDVQETGASNFLLINDEEIITKDLDSSFLAGVTRDSTLQLGQTLGYRVSERSIHVDEVLDWVAAGGEAALSGTAAVLAGVGTIIYKGHEHELSNGGVGPNTRRLRGALTDIQTGKSADTLNWLTEI